MGPTCNTWKDKTASLFSPLFSAAANSHHPTSLHLASQQHPCRKDSLSSWAPTSLIIVLGNAVLHDQYSTPWNVFITAEILQLGFKGSVLPNCFITVPLDRIPDEHFSLSLRIRDWL